MPGGRPTKLNAETETKLVGALRNGSYRTVACEFANISYPTFRSWMSRGQDPDDDPRYAEFYRKVVEAEAQSEVLDLMVVTKAARENGDWRAASWRLERGHPDRWGRHDRQDVQVSGPGGGPVDVQVAMGVDHSSIASLASLLARRDAERYDPLRQVKGFAEAPRDLDDEDLERFRMTPDAPIDTTAELQATTDGDTNAGEVSEITGRDPRGGDPGPDSADFDHSE